MSRAAPRLLNLSEAKAYLSGLDPRSLGIVSVSVKPLRFDVRAIDRRLDAMDPLAPDGQRETNDNETDDIAKELEAARERLKDNVA